MADKRDTNISRSMSKLLRHQAEREGLDIDGEGYVPLGQLLAHRFLKSLRASEEDVRRVVANDAKGRYGMKEEDGNTYIRAHQGHSIATVDEALDEIGPSEWPPILLHGTYKDKLDAICSTGLSKMKRNHIHLASGVPSFLKEHWIGPEQLEEVTSGLRKSCNCIIFIDTDKLKRVEGLKMFRSDNGVYLTAGINGAIPADYFAKVTDNRGNKI